MVALESRVRELFRTGRRSDVMRRDQRPGPAWLATFILILIGACTTSPAPPAQVRPSNHAIAHSFAGGCAGTVLTDAEPPVWAQTGFAKQTPWPVPWAFGTQDTAVAFLFSTVLVAGSSPRLDGSYNKVGWVAKGDYPTGNTDIAIEVRPLGEAQPVLTNAGHASVVDLPKAGCWTFRLFWSAHGQPQVSTINLVVLPAGSLPG